MNNYLVARKKKSDYLGARTIFPGRLGQSNNLLWRLWMARQLIAMVLAGEHAFLYKK